MGNPKNSKDFAPNHIGTQSKAGGNKGKQMQDQTGKQPIVDNELKEKENITFFLCINLRKDR